MDLLMVKCSCQNHYVWTQFHHFWLAALSNCLLYKASLILQLLVWQPFSLRMTHNFVLKLKSCCHEALCFEMHMSDNLLPVSLTKIEDVVWFGFWNIYD